MNLSIKCVMFSRVLCGFYCNNSFSRPVALIIRLYCITVCSFCVVKSVYIYLEVNNEIKWPFRIYFVIYLTEYVFNVLFCFATCGSFLKFYNSLKNIPSTCNVCTTQVPVTLLYTIFILVATPVNIVGFCINSSTSLVDCLPGVIRHTSTISTLSVCLVFELMWYQMKAYRKNMEIILSVSGYTASEDSKKAIKHSLIVYRSLINTMNHVSSLKFPVFLAHICLILKLLIIFDAIVNNNSVWLKIATILMEVFNLLVWNVLAACVSSEIDKVMLIIKKKLFNCPDISLQKRLEDALMYLTLRPFKFSVLRIFTIGADLFLSILSLVTTFLIILVQFSHVFD